MSENPPSSSAPSEDDVLRGTTLRVYRFLYKAGAPAGIHETQRALKLSSPSVAEYHIKKLLRAGLIQERAGGYTVDRVVFRNLIRIGRRTVIPLQTTYLTFFVSSLLILVILLRPAAVTSTFVFAIVVNLVATGISAYEVIKALDESA